MQHGLRRICALTLLLGLALCRVAPAQTMQAGTIQWDAIPHTESHFFTTSDGVRLHYLEAGPRTAHTIVFVPGWTMPAWIWAPQIAAFSHAYHVSRSTRAARATPRSPLTATTRTAAARTSPS